MLRHIVCKLTRTVPSQAQCSAFISWGYFNPERNPGKALGGSVAVNEVLDVIVAFDLVVRMIIACFKH